MSFQIFSLDEGEFTVGEDRIMVPVSDQTDLSQRRGLHLKVVPFLVVLDNELIVLDTGLGRITDNGNLVIEENILRLGWQPSQVKKVLITHLHEDHISGMQYTKNAQQFLTFPNATYYLPQKNWHKHLHKFTSEAQQNFVFLDKPEGNIEKNIFYQHTGGHSSDHYVYWITTPQQKVFFGGDEAPALYQMPKKLIAKYDFDGNKAASFRKIWWHQAQTEKWILLFYHDLYKNIYDLRANN